MALSLFVATISGKPLGKEEKDLIKSQIRASVYALEKEDAETIVSTTPEPIIAMMGGRDRMKESLIAALRQFRGSGVSIGAVEIGDDFELHEGAKHQFFVVRTRLVMVMPKQDLETNGYMLGVRLKASNDWKYVDGAKLTAASLKQLFPDIPQFELPEVKQRLIEK